MGKALGTPNMHKSQTWPWATLESNEKRKQVHKELQHLLKGYMRKNTSPKERTERDECHKAGDRISQS